MNHICGLSPEEPCRTECHYQSIHVQVHGKASEGDTKVEFIQKANLVCSCTVTNFTMVMATVTVYIFPTYAYCDQRQYIQRHLRKPHGMKVWSFIARVIQ